MRRPLLLLALPLALVAGCTGEAKRSPAPSAATTPVASSSPRPPEPRNASAMASAAPTEEAPPSPPYDAAADQKRRIANAKTELGEKTRSATVSDLFVVLSPPGAPGGQFDSSVNLMRSSMAGYMNGRFGRKPAESISVYLFPDAKSYEAFCTLKYAAPCIAHFGFYSPSDRYMVMNIGLGLGTLTHEMVHPLVEADFPHAPTWINEGIASVFEQPLLPRPGEIHGGKNWRHPRLARALASNGRENARLDRLFGMKDDVFRGDGEDLHYAMARYVCQWLDERRLLWPFYQRWRDTFADDPTGEKAFLAIVGMTPTDAHVAWSKWTLAL